MHGRLDGRARIQVQPGLRRIERHVLTPHSDVERLRGTRAEFPVEPLHDRTLAAMGDATLAKVLDELHEAVKPFQRPDGVFFGSAAWLVTARR